MPLQWIQYFLRNLIRTVMLIRNLDFLSTSLAACLLPDMKLKELKPNAWATSIFWMRSPVVAFMFLSANVY